MKLYVAGPMTGLPEFNYPAFFTAALRLEAARYEVLNPARRGVLAGKPWSDYLREAIADVLAADGIAVLDGWESSKGARLEVHIAVELGLPIASVGGWIRSQKCGCES